MNNNTTKRGENRAAVGDYYLRPNKKLSPFLACLVHYLCVGSLSILLHDGWIVGIPPLDVPVPALMMRVGQLFGIYSVWLLVFRLCTAASKVNNAMALSSTTVQDKKHATFTVEYTTDPKAIIWYEMTWLCNATLVMSSVALVTHRPLLAWAYGLTVAIDQTLWYLDGILYILTGKVTVGVFNHILLSKIPWYHHLTTWHHIWTLPLLGIATWSLSSSPWSSQTSYTILQYLGMEWCHCYFQVWILSGAVMTLNVLSSRALTPYGLVIARPSLSSSSSPPPSIVGDNRPGSYFHYLNINLCHEVWKELSMNISFLRIQQDAPPVPLYLARLLIRWFFLNTLILFAVLSVKEVYTVSCGGMVFQNAISRFVT